MDGLRAVREEARGKLTVPSRGRLDLRRFFPGPRFVPRCAPLRPARGAPPGPKGPPPATPPKLTLIKAGRLIDGRSAQAQTNVGILIEGERIRAVGPLAQVQAQ